MSLSIIITCSKCWHTALTPICDSSRLPLSEKLDSAVYVVDGLGPHCVLLRFLGIEEMGGSCVGKVLGDK